MDATKPRLGRGLDALIGDAIPSGPASRLPLDRIGHNPYQPRKHFGDDELSQLCDSIRAHGVLQPLVVRKVADGFQLIAGERRLRAARAAGLQEVPVHVLTFDDRQTYEAALAENIQRADLNAIEKAQGFKGYMDKFGVTQDQLAAKLGVDRTSVSNLIGLLSLPPEVQDAVRVGQLTMAHARALKGVADPARQVALCKEIVLKKLSVHALEQLLKAEKDEPKAERSPAEKVEKTAHVASVEEDLKRRLACRVEIKVKAKDRGQIVIGFESNDEFERVLGLLSR